MSGVNSSITPDTSDDFLTGENMEPFEEPDEQGRPSSPRFWLCKAYGGDFSYGGNDGHNDRLESAYEFHQYVKHSTHVRRGDILVLHNRNDVVGMASVQNVAQFEGPVLRRRCPDCAETDISSRKTLLPKWRCRNGHEFESPVETNETCRKYTAEYAGHFFSLNGTLPLDKIKKARRAFAAIDSIVSLESLQTSQLIDRFVPNWRETNLLKECSGEHVDQIHSLTMTSVVEEIERRVVQREIGRLQEIRKELKRKTRLPHHSLFHRDTIRDEYAFHYGGRTELQFNVGFETAEKLRHGVAFSFELSQTLPTIQPLIPKVRRFNEFLVLHPHEFADMLMWHWDGNHRIGTERFPSPITAELVRPGVFIFLGKMQSSNAIDYDLIVDDFDRLLALYRFVESTETFPEILPLSARGFRFRSGCTQKQTHTSVSVAERQLNLELRHNELQRVLHGKLAARYGPENVGAEIENAAGRIDIVLRNGQEYWFYEIKTAMSARRCIGEALSQLLEYSFWPGGQTAEKLIVVGEAPLDTESESYLATLRHRFNLPIEYQQLTETT